MMDDCCVSADSNFICSQPCNTLANILNILARNCHDNIIRYSLFLLLGSCFADKLNSLICMHTVSCVNLSVVDARHTIFAEVFFLEATASGNGGNIRQLDKGKTKNILPTTFKNIHQALIEAHADSVQKNKPLNCQDGRHNLLLCEAAHKSARNGGIVVEVNE